MSYQQKHSRTILPPGASRKRKEREVKEANASSYGLKPPAPKAPKAPKAAKAQSSTTASAFSSNRLLAGYMAYEYVTKGTLFGLKFDPARAEVVPLVSSSAEPRRTKPVETGKVEASSSAGAVQERYSEVASILKTDGAHIPGIVNPTELAKWIQM